MIKKHVVDPSNLPLRWSFVTVGMVWYLFLSHFDASPWIWGAVGCLWLLTTASAFSEYFTQERHRIFDVNGKRMP